MSGKLLKFMTLSRREKFLFLEALFFQFIIGLLLKIIPFRRIPLLFHNPSHLTPKVSPLTPEQIKTALRRTRQISPWKNKCLVQSLAARWMLSRRGICSQLSLGVMLGQNKRMIAHAWIKTADYEIVEKNGDYRELFLF